ncbi:MAG: hypothetical protein IPK19_13795 [Chloroflexi bacterium]|nr:hypothetical protein [Chloroflexota bacterium]
MSSQPLPLSTPTPLDVERIAALADPVIRNLQITQCYHELARTMAARTEGGANWCVFATWASRQAGQTIRKEDFSRTLERVLREAVSAFEAEPEVVPAAKAFGAPGSETEIRESVFEVLNPLGAFERASDAVARGNLKVFAEIGREFARFYATCLNDTAYDPAHITAFCAELRPGNPPEGQGYLRQAFTRYYQALFEPDPAVRAQLLLLANIEIGYHEQTRLQPEIAGAIDAAVLDPAEFQRRLIRALFPNRGWWARLRLFLERRLNRRSRFTVLTDALLAEARRRAHLVITEYLMTIGLPDGTALRLGRDLAVGFPESLLQIDLPDLCALLERIDPTPDSPRESGAVDWADLPDRLHFIIDLFRCYHEQADLLNPPFQADQVADLRAGHRPKGRL